MIKKNIILYKLLFFKFYLTLNLLFIFYKEDQNPFNSENI